MILFARDGIFGTFGTSFTRSWCLHVRYAHLLHSSSHSSGFLGRCWTVPISQVPPVLEELFYGEEPSLLGPFYDFIFVHQNIFNSNLCLYCCMRMLFNRSRRPLGRIHSRSSNYRSKPLEVTCGITQNAGCPHLIRRSGRVKALPKASLFNTPVERMVLYIHYVRTGATSRLVLLSSSLTLSVLHLDFLLFISILHTSNARPVWPFSYSSMLWYVFFGQSRNCVRLRVKWLLVEWMVSLPPRYVCLSLNPKRQENWDKNSWAEG